MVRLPLACTVRDCGLPLERLERVWRCGRGHSYDVARSGYLNLLQPQDRRSRAAGDSKASVGARARLLASGVGRGSLDAVVRSAAALELPAPAAVVDLGSGSGDALAALARRRPIQGIGIDLSTAAADLAARRYPDLTWVVANADRRLPLVSRSIDLVLSLHGRRHPSECARVIAPTGFLIVTVPAEDDLFELRQFLLGHALETPRAERVVAEHEPRFELVNRSTSRERQWLERDALLDLLQSTYRGGRRSQAGQVQSLERLEVTMASDILQFKVQSLGADRLEL